MNRLPTEEEFAGWNSMPQTDTLRQLAAQRIAELKEQWANGAFTYPGETPTLLKNAEALGEIKAWTMVLELDFERLVTELGETDG